MQMIDNKNQTLYEDLQNTLKAKSKVAIAAGCFSIYAYQALKKQLAGVDSFRFLFTSPTFIPEKRRKKKENFTFPGFSANAASTARSLKSACATK